ncbi:TatD family hydrolase [Spirochaeta cellobiosiphila]|uniref:TatD family hydrolase n=1 Tax=Spirochaeta cellobiosiphila TaxID=504483 RepID=UPI00048B310E|nr:TatD family hydrolase [Spirochaeta cellobiosiphila]
MVDTHIHLSYCSNIHTLPHECWDMSASLIQWKGIYNRSLKETKCKPYYGIHPWWAEEWNNETKQLLIQYLSRQNNAGVGEIGLDKNKGPSFDLQKKAFRQQLDIAIEHSRPVSLHCVKAWGAMTEILEEHSMTIPIAFHAYSGSPELIERLIRMGAYISFAPFNLRENNKKGRKALQNVPLNRLLLDSDFPYKENQSFLEYPQVMGKLLIQVSQLLGLHIQELEKQLSENLNQFLNKPHSKTHQS